MTVDLSSWPTKCGSRIQFLEHVQVRVNIKVWPRGDLLLTLLSPQGTESRLTQHRPMDRFRDLSTNLTDWLILTLHHWGEDPTGTWKLTWNMGNSRSITIFRDDAASAWGGFHVPLSPLRLEKMSGYLFADIICSELHANSFPAREKPVSPFSSLWMSYQYFDVDFFKRFLGELYNWTLVLFGTSIDPLKDNGHVRNAVVPKRFVKDTGMTGTCVLCLFFDMQGIDVW